MKKTILSLILLFFIPFIYVNKINAQTCDQGCLGTWCYVDVSLSDPTDAGYLIYTISAPPEGFTGGIIGPGSPRFFNNLGSTVDLYLRKSHLLLEVDENNEATIILDAAVNKYNSAIEGSISSDTYIQCHYHIVLRVTP